jgi:hypothetical protein
LGPGHDGTTMRLVQVRWMIHPPYRDAVIVGVLCRVFSGHSLHCYRTEFLENHSDHFANECNLIGDIILCPSQLALHYLGSELYLHLAGVSPSPRNRLIALPANITSHTVVRMYSSNRNFFRKIKCMRIFSADGSPVLKSVPRDSTSDRF